jgi:hypothetical protein
MIEDIHSSDEIQKNSLYDTRRINIHEPWELKYWAKQYKVTVEEIKKAVAEVGISAQEVKNYLERRRTS